jgi:hypothetical protein
MVAPRKYPEELQERSIRMTLETRKDPASRPGACRRIGEQLGITWRAGLRTACDTATPLLGNETRQRRRPRVIARLAASSCRGVPALCRVRRRLLVTEDSTGNAINLEATSTRTRPR